MSDYTSYDEAVQAILDAQQVVDSKYKAIGDASSTLCDINQTMVQIPDGSVTRNRGGDVIGYDYKYTTPQLPDIGIIGVDSNTDTGSFPEASGGGGHTSGGGAGRYRGSYYAGEVVDDPQSTDKAKSTGLVSGLVSAAWAGASALAKFGKNVAGATADTLDAMGVHFGANFGNFYVDAPGGDALRALFGVDNQGNTTMYLEEDVIGALAIQAKEDGFFNRGDTIVNSNPPGITQPTLINYPIHFIEFTNDIDWYNNVSTDAKHYRFRLISHTQPVYAFGYNYVGATTVQIYFCSKASFTIHRIPIRDDQTEGPVTVLTQYGSGAGGIQYYFSAGEYYAQLNVFISMTCPYNYQMTNSFVDFARWNQIQSWNLAHAVIAGYHEGGEGVPGVSDQDGAVIPVDAITGADPHVVAQNLESQYPSVMGTPVQIVVMDDSCNPVTKKYFSAPISYSPTNLNIGAPITGGLQVSPSFNPDVSLDLPDIDMDNYIDQIIKILGGSGAGRDVTQEPVPEDDPDAPSDTIPSSGVNYEPPTTGTGDTPPTTDPSVSVESMWHIYHALPAQLSALGQWLWSANIIDQIVRMFQNPMEAIMGVHALYCQPNIGSQVPIVVGNLTSTANAFEVTSQYQVIDCGSVWLTEYFGNVFDYDPFTEVSLYLPFVGIVKLDTADVMRAKIGVIYGVDCYTGACLAKVSVTRDGAGGVLYEFPGNCAVEYPVSGASYSRMLQSIVSAGMSAVHVGLRTGGAPGTAALGAASAAATFIGSGEKSTIQRAGSLGGNAGVFGAKIPYLIISRPQPNTAENFEHYQGIPSNNTVTVNSLSGFQRFESIHLRCPSAYGEELKEIESLLKAGVLI